MTPTPKPLRSVDNRDHAEINEVLVMELAAARARIAELEQIVKEMEATEWV